MMRLEIWLCFSLVLLFVQATDFFSFRLPRNSSPTSYSLKIVPDVDGDTFEGEVLIYLKISHSISNITLNSKNLVINEITLDQNYGTTKYVLDPANQIMYVLHADGQNIDPGEHILHIKYTGRFGHMIGFYKYQPKELDKQTILTTKFSPNHAREAFPCFDEPYFKSIFDLRLVKPNSSWEILSNMREIARYETAEGIAVDFESTVPMSTYLVAWAYTNYNYEEIIHKSNNRTIPLRFYASENKPLISREMLKYTKKALAFFENYTEIPFPLPKLDSMSIPSYRSKGMEHYGLIMYHDNAMFNPSPFSSKLYHSLDAMLLICHEVSHMWFGNLVTHQWYNDLWLTEGFARFMQYKAGEAVLGEPFVAYMFQENKYLTLSRSQCYSDAGAPASFPRRLNEISMKYMPSTYDQGGALLLMLEDLMGKENFREAVKKNLKEHEFSYSTTGEFINIMQEAAPSLNIREVMMTYLFQSKLPLINVTMERDSFILKQSPLCYGGVKSIFGDKWSIPIRYITSSNMTSRIIWFDREMTQVVIPRKEKDEWIRINQKSIGLYRVKYTREIYKAIAKDLKKLDKMDIGPFIEDAFFMSSLGEIPCDIPLKIVANLRAMKDMDYLTFAYASRSFTIFSRNFEDYTNVTGILRDYFIGIFKYLYHEVSWIVKEGETVEQRLLRIQVLQSFCVRTPKYPDCYTDVNFLTMENMTLHEDVNNIYKVVLKDMKELNSTILRQVVGEPPRLTGVPEGMKACISWIEENIPRFIQEKL